MQLFGELHPTGMDEYMKKKTNDDHDSAQTGKFGM